MRFSLFGRAVQAASAACSMVIRESTASKLIIAVGPGIFMTV